jgi:hypothetical protein
MLIAADSILHYSDIQMNDPEAIFSGALLGLVSSAISVSALNGVVEDIFRFPVTGWEAVLGAACLVAALLVLPPVVTLVRSWRDRGLAYDASYIRANLTGRLIGHRAGSCDRRVDARGVRRSP